MVELWGFEPQTPSMRSQLAGEMSWMRTPPELPRLFIAVRESPWSFVAVVTQLVAHPYLTRAPEGEAAPSSEAASRLRY